VLSILLVLPFLFLLACSIVVMYIMKHDLKGCAVCMRGEDLVSMNGGWNWFGV
jgi:hypothetical protein